MTSLRKGGMVLTDKEFEERKRDYANLEKRLLALKEAAHRDGLRYYTPDEVDDIWAEERAGGEGLNRVWNY